MVQVVLEITGNRICLVSSRFRRRIVSILDLKQSFQIILSAREDDLFFIVILVSLFKKRIIYRRINNWMTESIRFGEIKYEIYYAAQSWTK